MSQRNVDLVIRAKDQASSALQSVRDDLEKLNSTHGKVTQSAATLASSFSRGEISAQEYAAALAKLSSQASSQLQASMGRVGSTVQQSTAALDRQTAELHEARAAYAALAQQAAAARAAIAAQSGRMGPFTPEQQQRMAQAERSLREINTAVTKSGAALARAETQWAGSVRELQRVQGAANAAQAALSALDQRARSLESRRIRIDQIAQTRAAREARGGSGIAEMERRARAAIERNRIERDFIETMRRSARMEEAAARGTRLREQAIRAATRARVEANLAASRAARTGTGFGDFASRTEPLVRVSARESAARAQAALEQRARELESRRARLDQVTQDRAARLARGSGSGLAEMERRARVAAERNRIERDFIETMRRSARMEEAAARGTRRREEAIRAATRARVEANIAASRAAREASRFGDFAGQAEPRVRREVGRRADLAALREEARRLAELQRNSTGYRGAINRLRAAAGGFVQRNQGLIDSLRRTGRELTRLPGEANRTGAGFDRAASGAGRLRQAMQHLYGDSRRALSLMQRLRGEVLSMAATMVGFYGAFNQAREIYNASITSQQAEIRFNVAFDGDTVAARAELEMLGEVANRLGVNAGVLSKNYSQFLISAQQAGMEVDQVRNVFLRTTEAGRVLGLSQDQISRAFTALTQIAGKGVVSMEELRQQLGDQIPGAVGLVANALGYGEDRMGEFFKAVQNGAIDAESALDGFARGLEGLVDGQLDAAINRTDAKVGRLQNMLYERRLDAADAGFISGLEEALDSLNEWLESDAGVEFFESLGAAMGNFMGLLPGVLDSLGTLFNLFQVFLALKLGQFLGTLAAGFGRVGTVSMAAKRQLVVMRAELTALTAAAGGARSSLVGMQAALISATAMAARAAAVFRSLWAAIGGLPGLLLTAGSFVAMEWLFSSITAADRLNQLLSEQENQLYAVAGAYRTAGEGADNWRNSLEGVTKVEILRTLEELREGLDGAIGAFEKALGRAGDRNIAIFTGLSGFTGASREYQNEIENLVREFQGGEMKIEDFAKALDELGAKYRESSTGNARLADQINDAVGDIVKFYEAIVRQNTVLRAMDEGAEDADAAAEQLARSLGSAGGAADGMAAGVSRAATASDELKSGIRELLGQIPELTGYFEELEAQEAFDEQVIKVVGLITEVVRAQAELINLTEITSGFETAWTDLVTEIQGTSFVDMFAALFTDLDRFLSGLSGLFDKLGGFASQFMNVLNQAGSFMSGIGNTLSGAVGGVGNMLGSMGQGVITDGATAMRQAGFNDQDIRAIMAVFMSETSGNPTLRENMNYSAERLMEVFPGRTSGMSRAEIDALVAQGPQAIANRMYGRILGNQGGDDGWRFRGAGPAQLTGRDQFRKYGQMVGIDLEANPELAVDPRYMWQIAAAYFSDRMQAGTDDPLTAARNALSGGSPFQNRMNRPKDERNFAAISTGQLSGTPGTGGPVAGGTPIDPTNTGEWLEMRNQGSTRDNPLHPDLVRALGQVLPEMGLRFVVTSGGQETAEQVAAGTVTGGTRSARTGTTAHNHGRAADGDIYLGDRLLSHMNPADQPIFIEMVRRLRAVGIGGVGAGNPALGADDYMGPNRVHLDIGRPRIWSSVQQRGAPVAPWLREAHAAGPLGGGGTPSLVIPPATGDEQPGNLPYQQGAARTQESIAQAQAEIEVERARLERGEAEAELLRARQRALQENPFISAEELAQLEQLERARLGLEAEGERREQAAQQAADADEFRESLAAENEERRIQAELENADVIARETALALREAENRAREVGVELTAAERQEIEASVRARYAGQAADEARQAQIDQTQDNQERINLLEERRNFLIEQRQYLLDQGDTAGAEALTAELEAVNAQLQEAIANSIAFWESIGGEGSEAALQSLQQTQAELARTDESVAGVGNSALMTGEQINEAIASRATQAFGNFAKRVAEGEDAWTAFREEALAALADILIQIGQAIIKQAILNAVTGGQGAGGGVGGGLAGLIGNIFHGGGVAGQATTRRTVDPAIFANATRFHTGGVAGLAPDEIPAILQRGEEVITENDKRHRRNGGAGGGGGDVKIVNAIDSASVLEQALDTEAGERIILNWMKANQESVNRTRR